MKFLFWLNIGFDRGGPSVHLLQDVIRQALNQGHTVDVILKDTGGTLDKVPLDFLDYEAFGYTLISDADNKKTSFLNRYMSEMSYAWKCKKTFRKKKYDVVFLQSCNAAAFYMRALQCLKCPIVFNVQDIFPQNLMFSNQLPVAKFSYPILSKLQKYAYRKATKIITISDDMKCTLLEQGVDENKVDVVYNWSYSDEPISLEDMDSTAVKNIMMDNGQYNVLYAGNIGKMQNVEIVARAAQRLAEDRSVHFFIIGEGANKSNIVEMTKNLNNITFLPLQPACYAESLYAQANVNIIPLSRGGIFTALPSKTATCLRTKPPILFCIDRNSKFFDLISEQDDIYAVDCDDDLQLANTIALMKDSSAQDCSEKREKLRKMFSKANAEKYIYTLENTASK